MNVKIDVAFPLEPSDSRRYLVDQGGAPFFIHGDSPWDIFQNLALDEVREYLADRRDRGFNTLQVAMVADRNDLMRDREGRWPFVEGLDFSRPNEAYWAHVDEVMEEMAKAGFLVVSCPTWLGAGEPIWRDGITVENMQAYGAFLAERYGRYQNLIWLLGGDRNPEEVSEPGLRRLAEILHREAPHQLITFHTEWEHTGSDFFHGEPWYRLNGAYTYALGFDHVRREWQRTEPVLPVFLCETGYDGEDNDDHDWIPREIRKENCWALTSGACGHINGAKQLWWFGPGWRDWLDRPVTRQLGMLRDLLTARTWWKLEPDLDGDLLVAGAGDGWERATAAAAGDGSWGWVFVPTAREIVVDLSALEGAKKARWFDPTNGSCRNAAGSMSGKQAFTTPGANADGDEDWLLLLE